MLLPDEVVIFGRTYEIRDITNIHSMEGVLGLAAYRDGVIYVDENTDLSLSLNTLWHEATHIAQQEILGSTDEAQARWIALFAHNFLVNNPEILECYAQGMEAAGGFDEDD